MGQADVLTTTEFTVGLGNPCWLCQPFPLKKKSPKEIILLTNLPPVLQFRAGKPSLFCFAGMQSFQAALPHLHVDQFIHFHPRLTLQTPNSIKSPSPRAEAAFCVLCNYFALA